MKKPFIVAEMSASHRGDLTTARGLVEHAKLCGADAIKVQTWDQMTVADYCIQKGTWEGRDLRALYAECKLPWAWHKEIFDCAKGRGLVAFSTPFDRKSVDFLETLDCPIYKIASFEITDLPLIKYAASTGKPVILSTGMATVAEITAAVSTLHDARCKNITLLVCASAYPAPAEDIHLEGLRVLREWFNCDVGLSDHTFGSTMAIAATALGADVIEKHLTLTVSGPDDAFATMPTGFRDMVRACREVAQARERRYFGVAPSEKGSLQFRRSLWVKRAVARGEPITEENVGSFRPYNIRALTPSALPSVLGRCATHALVPGEPLLVVDVA